MSTELENVLKVYNAVPGTLQAFTQSGYYSCLLFMFPCPSLELLFMILDLYPKTTGQGRYRRKRTSPSLTKESMSLEIPTWRRKTITNHEGLRGNLARINWVFEIGMLTWIENKRSLRNISVEVYKYIEISYWHLKK